MSRKSRTLFFCKECGAESPQWFGRCPRCAAWNSLVEAPEPARGAPGARARGAPGRPRSWGGATGAGGAAGAGDDAPRPLGGDAVEAVERMAIGIEEFDRALGGGLVPGSLILLGGDPGVGKSTLALQAAGRLAAAGRRCLYVSGEESRAQVQLRARRIEGAFAEVLVVSEGDVGRIEGWAREHRPEFLVVDSIQTAYATAVEGAPGSITQIRECGLAYHHLAKTLGVSVLLIGHVTKEGAIAGPRLLEHMVDTVLYLEGERIGNFRVLRAVKNRFGSTDEIGLFEMREAGMQQVVDPSRFFVDQLGAPASGSVVVPTVEGTRPILLEVQALVAPTAYGTAQRVATGVDPKRLAVLLAVLHRHARVDASSHDVFINVVSGIRITEPAADLGVVAAVVSSLRDRPVAERVAIFGEVGLGGEVRGVSQAERRVGEALRVGFDRVIVPHSSWKDLPKRQQQVAVPVRSVTEALLGAQLIDGVPVVRRGKRPADATGPEGGHA